jgi:serine/threonine protein phosphatase PrpC
MPDCVPSSGAATDTGLLRDHNEDRYWIDTELGAYLVVDGMGGQAAGERAAEIAVAEIRDSIRSPGPAAARVRAAITRANNRIYDEAEAHPVLKGMACVLTLALIEGEQITVGHVGDSRLYLITGGTIRKLTSDHSPVGEGEDSGEFTEEEAMLHPRRHEVFRDVGSCHRPEDAPGFIEIRECPFPPDAAMLLCSDGLTDHLTSRRIREIADRYSGDPAQTARNMVDAANQAGGRDNITALFVAGAEFRGRSGATRPRLGATRVRTKSRMFTGRIAFMSYGLLLGMLLWAVLRTRG